MNCAKCGKDITAEEARPCQYCKQVTFCRQCAEAGALRIDDEMGIWMCDACVEKILAYPDDHDSP